MIRWTKRLVLTMHATALALALGGSPAHAVLQGDCGGDGTVFIGDVQQCVNIFLTPSLLPNCTACDQGDDGGVDIGDIQGAANCFLNPAGLGCQMVVTPVPTATSPMVATNTPVNTNTVPPPTNTPVNTNTIAPTSTPVPPTNTPGSTATATNTGAPGEPDFEVVAEVQGGGGIAAQCPNKLCSSGPRAGQACTGATQCRACVGGTNMGNTCVTNGQCPGSTCSPQVPCLGTCDGGSYDGIACGSALDCLGCNPNDICTAAGVPLACCTGNNSGNCPVAGSCAIVQNPIFAVRLGLNGICVPRTAPEDLNTASCLSDDQCPSGKTCQASTFTMQFFNNFDGSYDIRVPQSSLFLPPAVVSGIGTVCVVAGGDGNGLVDCDGGASPVNFTLSLDHNTTPAFTCLEGSRTGMACTSANDCPSQAPCPQLYQCASGASAGASCRPDTVECPGGQCVEGPMVCVGGTNNGGTCTSGTDCPGGGTCGEGPEMCDGGTNDGETCTPDSEQCPASTCAPTQPVCAGGTNSGMNCTPGGTDCPAFAICNNLPETPPSGNGGGLPDDPDCSNSFTSPAGVVDYACEEGTRQCSGGTTPGKVCTGDGDCQGGTCGGLCNAESFHPGVCNSPTVAEIGGTFVAGDIVVTLPLAISILDSPTRYGPDNLACTPDDEPESAPATVPIALSTGLNIIQVYDGANGRGTSNVLPGNLCGASPCVTQIDGKGVLCSVLETGSASGLTFGGGFPALDTTAGDIATTFQFVVP